MKSSSGTSQAIGKWSSHVQVNGAGQSGNVLVIRAPKGEIFDVDDLFTIADVHDVQPLTHEPCEWRKRFMVIERLVAKGNGLDVLRFQPAIIAPDEKYANVDALPANGAILEWLRYS